MLSAPLKRKIESRFGRPIRYSKDCEALALSLERACHEKVSATTLKRLFGFARSVEKPRLYTLNVLAEYVGYPDWSSLLSNLEKNEREWGATEAPAKQEKSGPGDIHDLNHQLIYSLTTQQIDTEKVVQLCRRYGKRAEIMPFFNDMVNLAGRLKNLQFLRGIFRLPNIFDESLHSKAELFYAGQNIGLLLRSYPELAIELTDQYAADKQARKYLVEWFVDEDYLDGYYGRLLDQYHVHTKSQGRDRLFYWALKYTQAALAGDVLARQEWYQKIKKMKRPEGLHPIVAARYTGICLAEEKNEKCRTSSGYYRYLRLQIRQVDAENGMILLLYLARYLFKAQRTDWICGMLSLYEKEVAPQLLPERSHWGVRIENQLWIYLAYAHYLEGRKREARGLMRRVDPGLFEAFMYRQIHNDYTGISNLLLK